MIAQQITIVIRFWATAIDSAPTAYPSRPSTYARLRPNRSPILLPMRMKAADTNASSAIADCTPLTLASRSLTTDEIETFISDVSTTSTNMAIASSNGRRLARLPASMSAAFTSDPQQPGLGAGELLVRQDALAVQVGQTLQLGVDVIGRRCGRRRRR